MSALKTTSASFARASGTTQYASGDLVANSATAGSVAALEFAGGPMIVRSARMFKSDDDITSASFRLHLFAANPCASAPANGDNGAISLNVAIADYLGSMDFDMASSPDIYNTAGNLARAVPNFGAEILVPDTVNKLYGLLEARGTYTPASAEVFTVELDYIKG